MTPADVLSTRAVHLYGVLSFETVKQDRRTYYRLTLDGRPTGSLTTFERAKDTVVYWQRRGWIERLDK